MIYRDDREALKNEVARLGEDLADARAKATGDEAAERRAQELAREAHALREQADRLEREVGALRGKRPSRTPAVVVTMMLGFAAASIGVFFFVRGAAPSPPPPVSVASEPVPHAPVAVAPPPPPPPPVLPTPAPEQTTKAPEPQEPPRETKARWSAKVTKSEGLALPPGAACTVDATIQINGTNSLVPNLVFACAGKQLYSSDDHLDGTAMMHNDARERLGPTNDKGLFSIEFRDTGDRHPTRNQIEIDSTKRIGSVWSDNLPRFRVDFALPIESAPTATLEHRLVRTGKVRTATGAAPAKEGASCTVRVLPTGQHTACVAEIICAGKALFTQADPAACDYRGSDPISAHGSGKSTILIDAEHAEVFADGATEYRDEIVFDTAANSPSE